MFLDKLLFIYDDFLDNIQPKMRKKLAVILLTIAALFIISYSIIDDDFFRDYRLTNRDSTSSCRLGDTFL